MTTSLSKPSAVPMYLEIAAGPALPVAGSSGALLRDYLAILAHYLDKPGAERTLDGVERAIANLPGLALMNREQNKLRSTLSQSGPTTLSAALANTLATTWKLAHPPSLQPLVRPLAGALDTNSGASVTSASLDTLLIVLQRPAAGEPTLGCTSLESLLEEQQPVVPGAPSPGEILTVAWTLSTYSALSAQLDSSAQFVEQLRAQGLLADLGTTPGYLQIIT